MRNVLKYICETRCINLHHGYILNTKFICFDSILKCLSMMRIHELLETVQDKYT